MELIEHGHFRSFSGCKHPEKQLMVARGPCSLTPGHSPWRGPPANPNIARLQITAADSGLLGHQATFELSGSMSWPSPTSEDDPFDVGYRTHPRWTQTPELGVASNMIFQTKRGHNLINHFKHYKPGTWLFPSADWSGAEAMQDSALYIINVWYIMILFQPALDQQTSVDQVGGHSLKISKHIKTDFKRIDMVFQLLRSLFCKKVAWHQLGVSGYWIPGRLGLWPLGRWDAAVRFLCCQSRRVKSAVEYLLRSKKDQPRAGDGRPSFLSKYI
jgi:hypothetical protein